MRILVTGATGVLGRRVLPLLRNAGHAVTAVARGKSDQVRAAGASAVDVDLFDAAGVKEAVRGHDAVLDLATSVPPTWKMALPAAWRTHDRLRREASRTVAEAVLAAGARRYVRESYFLVYADGGDTWLDEEAPVSPPPLTASVLDAEASARAVTDAGAAGIALRFASFYGPDAVHTRDLVATARRLGVGAWPGDPEGFVPFVHLDDAAAAVVAALHVPPGVYNVADDQPLRRTEHAEVLGTALGRELRLPPRWASRHGPAAQLDRSHRLDAGRFRRTAGWAPRFPTPREGWPQALMDMHS